jgi:16S rRNA (cytidine1402-2'-O)-methyltransferase
MTNIADSRSSLAESPLAAGLYLVATPLGNLGDMSARAVATLQAADIIACEDTRVTRRLCTALGVTPRRLERYDDHAGPQTRDRLVAAIQAGQVVALVADAGSPLIADPGYRLVEAVRAAGLKVTVVPGPSAVIAALMLAGFPTDRFLFAGFLPRGGAARRTVLRELAATPATLVFYEAPHRLAECLATLAEILGGREAAVVREITKLFEETARAPLAELAARYAGAEVRGEIVIVVAPPDKAAPPAEVDLDALLTAALGQASLREAVARVTAATGLKRAAVYARALALAKR